MKGSLFLKGLENSVSRYPRYEGRWPSISGFRFTFDPEKPELERITEITDDEGTPLEMDKTYTIAISEFLLAGKDGFECWADSSNYEILPPIQGEHDPSIQ